MKKIFLTFLLYYFISVVVSCSKKKAFDPINYAQEEIVLAKGCADTDYDDWRTSAYILPFPVGNSFIVNLSHCAGSYHSSGQPDQFAIDFEMPIGSSIIASRSGEVVFVEESGIDGAFPNNRVVIEHEDGTFGQYMHLTTDGALVRVGDPVAFGQEIALSGSTGLPGYPHLHFVVTENSYVYPYVSIPTTFRNTVANERSLASWTKYTALPY